MLPPGHGFGGITGKVSMKVCNSVYVADIYMQNTPQITTANAILTLQNEKGKTAKQDLRITVLASGKRKYIENRCEKYQQHKGFCG